jgi:subfamily B ATP-binding cassette protein MsbA
VTLSIPAGKMTALVGRSGAGKSTLVDLIPRLREPQEGRILIDGTPIGEFSLGDLRRAIAFVPQDSFLFDDTVANNIRFVRPDAGQEDVESAARQAYADVFIRALPDGYNSRIGERGVRLSGGERQRIVLAQALLQKAPIVVLDEPTSALDSDSERYIQRAIVEIRATGRTTLIVIAHRLSTIKTADQITILDGGEVTGIGKHRDLLEEMDWYANVVAAQTGV